jgi:hypothetical protein
VAKPTRKSGCKANAKLVEDSEEEFNEGAEEEVQERFEHPRDDFAYDDDTLDRHTELAMKKSRETRNERIEMITTEVHPCLALAHPLPDVEASALALSSISFAFFCRIHRTPNVTI